MEHTGFPSDETLAAFLDGRLDPDTRRRVIEHMTTCNECYAVVAGGGAAFPHADSPAAVRSPVVAGRFTGNQFRVLLATAAALAVVAITSTLVLQHERTSEPTARTSQQTLADFAPPTRRIEGRLTGFRYAPLDRRDMRGATDKPLWYFGLASVSASLANEAARHPTPQNLHNAGVSLLLINHTGEAVEAMEQGLRKETRESDITAAISKSKDANLLSDLAAAYCERGTEAPQSPRDFLLANDAAERAYVLAPRSREVVWNRAVAIEHLHMPDRTNAAWRAYLALDDTSDWAREAATRRRVPDATTTEGEIWRQVVPMIEVAARTGSAGNLDALIRPHVSSARAELIKALNEWAHARSRGDSDRAESRLQFAAALALELRRIAGDAFGADAVESIRKTSDIASAQRYVTYFDLSARLDETTVEAARESLERIVLALEQLHTPFALVARTDVALCQFYREAYPEVLRSTSAVAAAARERHYWAIAGRADALQGLSYNRVGKPYDAIRAYRSAIDAYQHADETAGITTSTGLLAEIEHTAGRDDEAWRDRFAALTNLSAVPRVGWRESMLANTASSAKADGHLAPAMQFVNAAVDLSRAHDDVVAQFEALVFRGELHYTLNDDLSGARDFRSAGALLPRMTPKIAERAAMFAADVEAASLEQRQPAQSLVLLDDAIEQAGRVGLRNALPQLHCTRARVLLRMGRPAPDIIAELQSGISVLEESQQGASVADRTEEVGERLYRLIVAMLMRNGDAATALRYADRYRLYALRASRDGSAAEWQQPSARGRQVSLSYLFTPDGLWAFVERDGVVRAQRIETTESDIRQLVARLWTGDGTPRLNQEALGRLSATLVRPIEPFLGGTDILAIVPDRVLHRIPFAALTITPGVALAARHAVVRMQFAQLVAASDPALPRSGPVLVFGNPAIDRTAFGYLAELPKAEEEARLIAHLHRNARLYVGSAATLSAFVTESAEASIVEVATHGLSVGDEPLNSALLFAPDRVGGSGALYAKDVLKLDLHEVRLVVLSACSTADSTLTYSGASMASAFASAGVRHVLATLSRVDDGDSMRFVTAFNERLTRNMPIIQAFHETQMEFLASANGGAHWATFELMVRNLG